MSTGRGAGRGVRAQQAMFVGAGLLVAAVMLLLGLWQMQRSIDSGAAGIAARAAEPAIPLLDYINPDGTFEDVYGKVVTVSGTYVPGQQVLVVASDGTVRVLTALALPDGRVVPVVRGSAASRAAVPTTPPPTGTVNISGIFLPGEADSDAVVGAAELASVRTPLLAQRWPQQLVPGFVTLDAAASAAQGLGAASVTLPKGDGSLQNGSYALQWWVFAAFGLGMSIKLAHGVGEKDRRDRDEAAVQEAVGSTVHRAEQSPVHGAERSTANEAEQSGSGAQASQ